MLPTIFENKPTIMMDYYTPTPTELSTLGPSSPPSTPRQQQQRRKMIITFEDRHVFVPVDENGVDNLKLKIEDFPSLPFKFLCQSPPPPPVEEDTSSPVRNEIVVMPTTKSSPTSKLPNAVRNQSLAHIDRRRKSYSARCA